MDKSNRKQPPHTLAKSFKLNASEGTLYHGTKASNEVINLSNHTLTGAENKILQKGLKFVPTPKTTSQTPILTAATEFSRRIKLIRFFHYKRTSPREPFTAKSCWTPPEKSIPQDIIKHLRDMEQDIQNLNTQKIESNITQSERTAIQNLRDNPSLIIKKADKGSATVLMNKEDYIFECNRQLTHSAHYEPIHESRQISNSAKIIELLEKMHSESLISDKQFAYLKPPESPRPRRFYTLPKIHKEPETWTKQFRIPPGRPIISNCNSETEKVHRNLFKEKVNPTPFIY